MRAIALRDVRPRRSRAQPPEYPVQNPPVIDTRHPARLVRQQRLYHRPLEVRQIETSHPNLQSWKFESLFAKIGNPFYGYVTYADLTAPSEAELSGVLSIRAFAL